MTKRLRLKHCCTFHELRKYMLALFMGITGESVQRFELRPGFQPSFQIAGVDFSPSFDRDRQLRSDTEPQTERVENLIPAAFGDSHEAFEFTNWQIGIRAANDFNQMLQLFRLERLTLHQRQSVSKNRQFIGECGKRSQYGLHPLAQCGADGHLHEEGRQHERKHLMPIKHARHDERG
jgi:hypothetical protein